MTPRHHLSLLLLVSSSSTLASVISRRQWVASGAASCAAGAAGCFLPRRAAAFDNALPEYANYADKPKRRGAAPKNLGVAKRVVEGEDGPVTLLGLRECDGKPDCFSTTGDEELEERVRKGVDTLIPAWTPPTDDPAPLRTLAEVVRNYKPGQGGVDGGGFQVVSQSDEYFYVQFEALKKGFIDDVEFAMGKGAKREVLVRSSSRVGYTDFGVNAVRLNYISASLREKGWKIDEITPKSHSDYWVASNEAREATFDADRRKLDGGEEVSDTVKASQVFNR